MKYLALGLDVELVGEAMFTFNLDPDPSGRLELRRRGVLACDTGDNLVL